MYRKWCFPGSVGYRKNYLMPTVLISHCFEVGEITQPEEWSAKNVSFLHINLSLRSHNHQVEIPQKPHKGFLNDCKQPKISPIRCGSHCRASRIKWTASKKVRVCINVQKTTCQGYLHTPKRSFSIHCLRAMFQAHLSWMLPHIITSARDCKRETASFDFAAFKTF